MHKMMMACLAAVAALVFVLGGCAGNTPRSERMHIVDDHWGRSVESVNFRQTLDPEAGLDEKPVEGFEGRSAGTGVDKHRRTFEERVDPAGQVRPTIF